ncbi:alpha/beta hydrolase family protein [Aliidiomarina iranensis]|nr:alpha/beta hydrolase [Aliidiomarina iranensis]
MSAASAETKSFGDLLERSSASPDSIIRYGAAEPQFIELYLTPSKAQTFAGEKPPLVAFVHGGCWLNSFNINHTRGLASGLRNAGFSTALIEYRRLDDEGGGWPNTLSDIERAVSSLAAKSNSGYNPENIILMGHSAGGHLALLASQPERALPITAVVGLAAITDIERYAEGESGCEQAAARFLATAPEQTQTMNPVKQKRHENVTLFLGGADTIVAAEQGELPNAQVIHLENTGHFDLVHPDTAAFARVLEVLEQLNTTHSLAPAAP